MKRLIILRGNSGSGKTTVAKSLQKRLGRHTILISQDVVRREVLRVRETEEHPVMELIQQMAEFGWQHGWETVIIEGILHKNKYKKGLETLIQQADVAYVYYFDISFNETVRRHTTKPVADDYGETEMREWWQEQDYLHVTGEQTIDEHISAQATVDMLAREIENEYNN